VDDAEAAMDWIADRVLDRLAHRDEVSPTSLRLLVRRFAATGRDDLRDALGPALADAVAPSTADADGAESLLLFVEALDVSDDGALHHAVRDGAAHIRGTWPSRGAVAGAMSALTASLIATTRLDESDGLSRSVDELERVVGRVYEPGDGVAHEIGKPRARGGDLRDQTATASALLCAHALTGRLPYAMLAEELMQFARRTWWNPARGCFGDHAVASPSSSEDFAARPELAETFSASCSAAVVLCRLAAIRNDADYRTAVVAAEHVDYAAWAKHVLLALASTYRDRGDRAAEYGLALHEWRGGA
jgi:uncharacterized protein YyaL (SSP411 family)